MNFEQVFQIIKTTPDSSFGKGISDDEIKLAETRLKVLLPDDYKLFLKELGWCGVGHIEINGLGSDVPKYLHLIEITESERNEAEPNLASSYVPICNDGGGNLYCLDVSQMKGGKCPVIFRTHDDDQVETLFPSFSDWLKNILAEI